MKLPLLMTVFAAFLLSCHEKPSAPSKTIDVGFTGKEGDTLESGQFVFHVFESVKDTPSYRQAVTVAEDYGMIIFNTGTYDNPALTVKFCSPKEKWIKLTSDLDEAVSFIQTLRKDATLGVYDTCCVPRHAGIPDEMIDKIYRTLAARQITVKEQVEGHITCVCPIR